MIHKPIRGAMLGAIAGGLAACASSPAYPIMASPLMASPPPASQTNVPPSSPAPASAALTTAHPAPDAVGSTPLAPVEAPAAQPAVQRSEPPPPPPAPVERPSAPPPVRYIATGKVVDARGMYRDYVVRNGDHIDAIARDLQTTREVLVQANHLKDINAITPGQHLKVPVEKAYVVQAGDTMAAVAKRFDVNLDDLADLNALPVRARLQSGDELALPAEFHDKGPVAAPPLAHFAPSVGYRPSRAALEQGRFAGTGITPIYPPPAAAPTQSLTDAQVTAAGKGRFVWPVKGEILSSFGVKDVSRRNDGIDIKAAQGAPVAAAASGEVVYAGDQVPGFGNLVLVKHADGWVTAYAHLDHVAVKMRQLVDQGEVIGQVGVSGGVSEPQLHFEVRYAPSAMEKAKPIDPQLVLPQ